MANSVPEKPDKRALEYLNIVEGHRTRRLRIVVVGIVICVVALTFCLFKALDRPWWQSLLIGLGAAIIPNIFPTWVSIKVFRSYVRRKNARIKVLESTLDKKRTTSGLEEDGTPKQ